MGLWLKEVRANFLVLPVVLIFLGSAMGWREGYFGLGYAALALLGLVSLHISVNLFNEYHDYKAGIDLATKPTPFSGGSGVLSRGLLSDRAVLKAAVISFLAAVPVGIFFLVVRGWAFLPLLVVGAACVLFYSPFIYRTGFSEFTAGLGLGTLPVLGAYYVQTGYFSLPALLASVPSGILVCNLLFLNEFPDADADRIGKRKTLPILIGKLSSAKLYLALNVICYAWIICAVILKYMPVGTLLALFTLPLSIKAVRGAFHYDDEAKMVPAQAANVMMILLMQILLGIGYLVGKNGCPVFN